MEVVNAFGVGTSRYNGCLPVPGEPFLVDIATGPCVARWDVRSQVRLSLIQAHTNAVSSILPRPGTPRTVLATTSVANEIALWSADWKLIYRIYSKRDGIMHSSWSPTGDFFMVVCESGAAMEIFKCHESKLTSVCLIEGHYEYAELNSNGCVVCFMNGENYKMEPQQKQDFGVLQLIQTTPTQNEEQWGYTIRSVVLPGKAEWTSSVTGGGLVAGIRTRSVTLVDLETGEIVASFDLPGSGIPKSAILSREQFVYPSSNGVLRCNSKASSSVQWDLKVPSGDLYYMNWAIPEKRMWYITESQVLSLDMEARFAHNKPEDFSFRFHDTVCCGVALHPTENYVAVGDFGGQIWIWALSADKTKHELVRLVSNLMMPVRALTWCPDGSIQCGLLDGSVWNWARPFDQSDEPKIIANFLDGITAVEWENGQEPKQFAVSTTDGTLALFYVKDSIYRIRLAFKAHKPSTKPQDPQFGSLTKFAEVWSIAWSPNNQYIASSSEDQQTCIWNMNGEKLSALTGHKSAVTSVKWAKTQIGEVLATCADDKTVMLWSCNSSGATPVFQLHHVFNTVEIAGWHTVTYLSFQLSSDDTLSNHWVSCVTQNGWLCVFDLSTKEKQGPFRVHLGSIEGLQWDRKRGLIATCSSDTNLMITKILNLH